jgi:Holliday junction resolvasome RuvABC endonuclease subunit
MVSRVLALDLGLTTGVVRALATQPPSQWACEHVRLDDRWRYLDFNKLLDFQLAWEPHLIVYEEVAFNRGASTRIYYALWGLLLARCEERCLPLRGVNVSTLKQHAVGKGGGSSATKEHMVAAASDLTGRAILNDDEADALHLADYAFQYFK